MGKNGKSEKCKGLYTTDRNNILKNVRQKTSLCDIDLCDRSKEKMAGGLLKAEKAAFPE